MIIACVGSREISRFSVKYYLEAIGAHLAEGGHTISTGNAPGADQAFALGANLANRPELVELYLPWPDFQERAVMRGNRVFHVADATPEHEQLALQAAAGQYQGSASNLFLRNAMIIRRFDKPVDAVYAWPRLNAPDWGGTGHAIRVAQELGIPVYILNQQRWL